MENAKALGEMDIDWQPEIDSRTVEEIYKLAYSIGEVPDDWKKTAPNKTDLNLKLLMAVAAANNIVRICATAARKREN